MAAVDPIALIPFRFSPVLSLIKSIITCLGIRQRNANNVKSFENG